MMNKYPDNEDRYDREEEAMAMTKQQEVAEPREYEQSPIMDDQGSFTPEWYRRFEELEEYAPSLAKFQRPEALAKSYAMLERMKGYPGVEDKRRMPAFRRSVGLPDRCEDYVLERPSEVRDGVWDESLASDLSQLAYEYGVPAQAMEALSAHYCDACEKYLDACQLRENRQIERAHAELQRAWGWEYDDNMNAVKAVLYQLGDREGLNLESLAENSALRANPDFAKLMLGISNMIQEAPMREGEKQNHQDEAYRIAHDPTHPLHEAYMKTSHPQHKEANREYDRHAFRRR